MKIQVRKQKFCFYFALIFLLSYFSFFNLIFISLDKAFAGSTSFSTKTFCSELHQDKKFFFRGNLQQNDLKLIKEDEFEEEVRQNHKVLFVLERESERAREREQEKSKSGEFWQMEGASLIKLKPEEAFLRALEFERLKKLSQFISNFEISPDRGTLKIGITISGLLNFSQVILLTPDWKRKVLHFSFGEGVFAGLSGNVVFLEGKKDSFSTEVFFRSQGEVRSGILPFWVTDFMLEKIAISLATELRDIIENEERISF